MSEREGELTLRVEHPSSHVSASKRVSSKISSFLKLGLPGETPASGFPHLFLSLARSLSECLIQKCSGKEKRNFPIKRSHTHTVIPSTPLLRRTFQERL